MRSLIVLAIGMVAFDAAAADYPTTGMLYNQQEDADLKLHASGGSAASQVRVHPDSGAKEGEASRSGKEAL
ncbi:hypothetical protein [Ensifer sp. 4252]|uniref:hypothetical protein n=1 Tax=Ensifer sp. 4252 TaxID=3373915 RepID=UPI003D1A6707